MPCVALDASPINVCRIERYAELIEPSPSKIDGKFRYGSENAKMPLPAGMTIICLPPASKLIGLEDMVPPRLMRHFSRPVSASSAKK